MMFAWFCKVLFCISEIILFRIPVKFFLLLFLLLLVILSQWLLSVNCFCANLLNIQFYVFIFMHISQHRSVYIYQSQSFLCQSRRFPCKILYRFLRQNSCCNQAHPRRGLAWLGSKRIFAIRFATCRIIRDPPASGSFLMIFHNLYHMWAWLTYDTSKSPPTAYCSAQLKQGTCLTRLKKAAARVSFLWLLHSHKLLLSSIVFEKCIMQKKPRIFIRDSSFSKLYQSEHSRPAFN